MMNQNQPTDIDTRETEPTEWPPAQTKTKTWPGRVQNGKFYCDCEDSRMALCRAVRDTRIPANIGRKFWCCHRPRTDPHQCNFYIWDDEAVEAREWLVKFGPPPVAPVPETPSRVRGDEDVDKGNPWTKSIGKGKRKAGRISRENSGESENEKGGGQIEEEGGMGEKEGHVPVVRVESTGEDDGGEEVGYPGSPSRRSKARKRFLVDNPGQDHNLNPEVHNGVLTDVNNGLPTPDTHQTIDLDKNKGKGTEMLSDLIPINFNTAPSRLHAIEESQRATTNMNNVIDFTDDTASKTSARLKDVTSFINSHIISTSSTASSALTGSILELLSSEGFELRDSTRILVADLVDTEIDSMDVKVRRGREMVMRLSRKVEELESMVLALTGGEDDGNDADEYE